MPMDRGGLQQLPAASNRTNDNAFYGPINDLLSAANEGKVLAAEGSSNSESNSSVSKGGANCQGWKFFEEHQVSSKGNSGKSVSASVLSWKLRWSTLGLQFEWSKLPHDKIPDTLCQLAKRLAKPAMPLDEEFQPEGAIVNYFGHLDDMEADWSKPIVSMSLGCKAIFLLGGKLREDPPTAMFLRSGDFLLMARKRGNAFMNCRRWCYTRTWESYDDVGLHP